MRREPTIRFVGGDSLSFEHVRASLVGGPFRLVRSAERPAVDEADLVVVAARDLRPPSSDARSAGSPPVIAHGPAGLMRAAFLAGCADYLREPWTPQELALRAEAALARRRATAEFPWGRLDWDGDTLRTPRGPVFLTRQQAVILRVLLDRRGGTVARAALAVLLGEPPASRCIDVQVSRIRRAVRAAVPAAGRFIVGVRRQGYLVP